jgi:hypothetical protein
MRTNGCLSSCAAVCALVCCQPLYAVGARAGLCVPVPVCVRASPTLFFLLAGAWAPLSLPHTHLHMPCAVGRAAAQRVS